MNAPQLAMLVVALSWSGCVADVEPETEQPLRDAPADEKREEPLAIGQDGDGYQDPCHRWFAVDEMGKVVGVPTECAPIMVVPTAGDPPPEAELDPMSQR